MKQNNDKHMDYIYLAEDYYNNPKEYFKFIHKELNKYLNKYEKYDLLDIGCAKGEFIYFLHGKNKDKFTKLYGIDNSKTLISKAKNIMTDKNISFKQSDAETFNLKEKFDFITISGVMGYFDDLSTIIGNINKHLKRNGKAFLFNFFNSYDIDVIIRYRNNRFFNKFESGWNMHSLSTLEKIINNKGFKIISKKIFKMPFKLKKQKDPGRSWTLKTDEGTKFVNGINLIYDLYLITLEKI